MKANLLKNKTTTFILFAVVFLILAGQVKAATQIMTACTSAAFNSAYLAASNGDTILFPEGMCNISTWTEYSIAKQNLTIMGRGVDKTSITSTNTIFTTPGPAANGLRITGIRFNASSDIFILLINGTGSSPTIGTQNLRVDNCALYGNGGGRLIQTNNAQITGVADHNLLVNAYPFFIMGGYRDKTYPVSYPRPSGINNNGGFFIEDNTFSVTGTAAGEHQIIMNVGSSVVIRYNTFNFQAANSGLWEIIDTHGACYQSTHGTFLLEVYENNFNIPSGLEKLLGSEGGQLIVWNNRINITPSWPITMNQVEFCGSGCQSGMACSAYPCLDQTRYSGFWNNKKTCGSDMTNCSGGSVFAPISDCSIVQLNRDYYTTKSAYDTAMGSTYIPYQYPHPLTQAGQPTCTPGDANSDGNINISDVQTCINVILGTDITHQACSDMNTSSTVDITDCQAIINKILNP